MKRRKVETYEYVLTKEEISMVMDICAMCVNRDIHSLGNHKGYYDRIKENANQIYSEILNRMGIDLNEPLAIPTEKGSERMWISVEDKLPPKFEHVLCYFPKRGFKPYIQISYKESNGSFADEFKWGEVTHWMPLPDHPAPYEREEDEGK